jgi:hypothetical protein
MLKRIRVIPVLVSALLVVLLAASVALAEPPAGKGNAGTEFPTTPPDEPGAPDTPQGETPQGFGAVTSQVGSTTHTVGEHSSGFAPGQDPEGDAEPAQRLGVGNVARNDGDLANLTGTEDPGIRPGDHACLIGELDDLIGADPTGRTDCEAAPGLPGR